MSWGEVGWSGDFWMVGRGIGKYSLCFWVLGLWRCESLYV